MIEQKAVTPKALGEFAPKLLELTDQVLFGDVCGSGRVCPNATVA